MQTELLSTLRRNPARTIKKAGCARSILITKRGTPAAYLIAARKFEVMRRRIARLETKLGLAS